MSRTDNHAPPWVKDRDPYRRREFRPEHDHWYSETYYDRDGRRWVATKRLTVPCDLDVFMTSKGSVWTRCRMVYAGSRNIYCGCRMCTGHDGRRLARKQERVAWRRYRANVLAITDRSDVDIPPLRGSAW